MESILKVKSGKIVSRGSEVMLKGVNAGGWLMMEAYFMHSPNRPEKYFREIFRGALGPKELDQFDQQFRSHFIQESDFQNIAKLGMNCIRLPFHFRVVEDKPFSHKAKSIVWLDKAVAWAKKYKIYVILDLHAAPGSQNHDWHSDSLGKADLWHQEVYRNRVYALWEFVADRYKDEDFVAGYDVLNEAVMNNVPLLNAFYRNVIKSIRSVDRKHIIFIEGNRWAQDLHCLEDFSDENYALSVHNYEPGFFSFNFNPYLKYPFKSKHRTWNRNATRKLLMNHYQFAKKRKLPVLVGEFGVNYRHGLDNEHQWLKENLEIFNEFGFHWTYWTYKAVKNSCHPDGIYSYYENPVWVNRGGPLMGWETYHLHWPKHKKDMVESWQTKSFQLNKHVAKAIKDAI